jgi:salicylate hydroxylase
MIPFMGQGGAMAIEDAAAITAALIQCGDDVEAALTLYETVRLPRATRVQNGSWENLTRFHMPDGPAQVERDALMAKGMTDWSYKHIAWLYGHDAAELTGRTEMAQIPGH